MIGGGMTIKCEILVRLYTEEVRHQGVIYLDSIILMYDNILDWRDDILEYHIQCGYILGVT